MSVSTDGIICHGIYFEEDFQFPWHNDEFDYDIGDWWIHEVCGFKSPVEMWNDDGQLRTDIEISKEDFKLYYDSKREFSKDHPIPVELVRTASDSCVEFIIAVPGSKLSASRGYPNTFDPNSLVVTDEQREALVEFCKKYLGVDGEPKWYLSSYWG